MDKILTVEQILQVYPTYTNSSKTITKNKYKCPNLEDSPMFPVLLLYNENLNKMLLKEMHRKIQRAN